MNTPLYTLNTPMFRDSLAAITPTWPERVIAWYGRTIARFRHTSPIQDAWHGDNVRPRDGREKYRRGFADLYYLWIVNVAVILAAWAWVMWGAYQVMLLGEM